MPGTQPADPETEKKHEQEPCKQGEHASVKMKLAYLELEARRANRPPAQTVEPSIGVRRERTTFDENMSVCHSNQTKL